MQLVTFCAVVSYKKSTINQMKQDNANYSNTVKQYNWNICFMHYSTVFLKYVGRQNSHYVQNKQAEVFFFF